MNEPAFAISSPPRRLSRAEAQLLVTAWRASGISRAAFARSQGVEPKVFYRWMSGLERLSRSDAAPAFVPVQRPQAFAKEQSTLRELTWHLPDTLGTISGPATVMHDLLGSMLRDRAAVRQ